MIWKRQIPILIVTVVGWITILGWYIDQLDIQEFVNDDATQWFDILASFAIILGALNLIKLQMQKILYQKPGWVYSVVAVLGFVFSIIAGFFIKGVDDSVAKWGAHVTTDGTLFKWMFDYMFSPMSATMFSLLAFFVASASYRAFRIRNFEATLLLVSGIILMLGRVPVGALIPWYLVTFMYIAFIFVLFGHLIKDRKIYFISFIISNIILFVMGFMFNWHLFTPSFLSIPLIQEWIFAVPATAGARAIMIGIALGTVAQSFRIITGREKTILGD